MPVSELLDKIEVFEQRANRLEEQLADPAIATQAGEYARLAKELAALRPAAHCAARYRRFLSEQASARAMLAEPDAELRELAKVELRELEAREPELERELRGHLIPRDPNDQKSAILEIRAGTGGDEASLFAMELFRMYTRYAERQGWKVEPLSLSESEAGGIKEVVAGVSGLGAFSRLKYERGVHRVQRVPATESQGRIHTSTVTVAVLPEAEEVDIQIDPKDLRVDVFRSSGPGGQSVNTTDSAVRITHIPTNVVVQCQDEESQHKNKARAMKILRSRLLEAEQARVDAVRANERRSQVGHGERSEKIRTYNYPQSRVTDHRAGVTLHQLEKIVQGDLDPILDAVHVHMTSQALGEKR